MSYGLAIDPGVSNGVCLFQWSKTTAMTVENVWQFSGGAVALAAFLEGAGVRQSRGGKAVYGGATLDALVVEKFTPRQNAGFALTQASVEPLRGEGVIIGRGVPYEFITWQQPGAQYFMGGNTPSERKKRSREFLKTRGMHYTGKDVASPDADDAISAVLHATVFMRSIRHAPTLKEMFS